MTTDLTMLLWVAILSILQAFPYTLALIARAGPIRAMSYPQPVDMELPDWAVRSRKAHGNIVENIGPFAIVVLIAHVSGAANAATALGATIFFWSRVAMVIGHTAAIPFLRSLAWFVSLYGIGLIIAQIL